MRKKSRSPIYSKPARASEPVARTLSQPHRRRLNNPPPVAWDLSQFSEPEIVDYLRESDQTLSRVGIAAIAVIVLTDAVS